MVLQQLRRVRWAVRATLLLGVAASVVANVLHALDNPISQAIAAWPPLALLLTVELISRVPVHRRYLAVLRLASTAIIAGIAAWVSYWHMVGVAARYGETGASPYLLPLSVDGLIVVASICLVELGGRISTLERAADPEPEPALVPVPAVEPPVGAPSLMPSPLSAAHARVNGPAPIPVPRGAVGLSPATAAALAEVAAALPRTETTNAQPTTARSTAPRSTAPRSTAPRSTAPRPAAPRSAAPRATAASGRVVPAQRSTPGRVTSRTEQTGETPSRARRTPAETFALAEQIKAARPGLSEAEIAAELGISPSRWRSIRRESSA